MRVTVVATGIKEESEDLLPENVSQLADDSLQNRNDQEISGEKQQAEESREKTESPRKNKQSRQNDFDEDFFDKPTFLRIKRN